MAQSHLTKKPEKHADEKYEAFLVQLSEKGRAAMAKPRSEARPANEQVAELWRRLAGVMCELAPHAPEVAGLTTAKMHIRDGKRYKQQVFALEQEADAVVAYVPDVLQVALKRGILARTDAPDLYTVGSDRNAQIRLELVTADTRDVGVCKAMLGWGRRALRIRVSVMGHSRRMAVVEHLGKIAAEAWADRPE